MRENRSFLAEIFDTVSLAVLMTAVSFLLFRTQQNNLNSLAGAIGVSFVLLSLFRAGRRVKKSETEALSVSRRTAQMLTYSSKQRQIEYFARALERFGAVEGEDCVLLAGKKVYCLFCPSAAFAAEAVRIHETCARQNTKAVIITCCEPDAATKAFTDGSPYIKVMSAEKVNALIRDMPPLPKEKKPKRKGRLGRIAAAVTDRKLFRRYIGAAALLIGSSYILPSSPFYIAVGALCVALALLCLLPKKSDGKKARG
ncbi:MAG: hypothetical protein HFE48_00165 [Clostridia bacterium]|nr:hypothetical protein [Clostridia bacterium]